MAGIEEDISDTEQLPVPSPKGINLMMASAWNSIKTFTETTMYKSGIAHSFVHLTHFT